MTRWQVCHQSGRVLFTTDNEVTARNREQFGWKVIKVDKSREQFEQWVINENKLRISAHDNPLKRCAHSYYYGWVSSAWEVWQASRAAIEIDLGPDINPLMFKDDVLFGYHKAKGEVASLLRSIGFKVNDIANDTGTE